MLGIAFLRVIRTGNRCDRRTQLSVAATRGRPSNVAPLSWSFAHATPWTRPRKTMVAVANQIDLGGHAGSMRERKFSRKFAVTYHLRFEVLFVVFCFHLEKWIAEK
jgi:hypothetical protein